MNEVRNINSEGPLPPGGGPALSNYYYYSIMWESHLSVSTYPDVRRWLYNNGTSTCRVVYLRDDSLRTAAILDVPFDTPEAAVAYAMLMFPNGCGV